MGAVDINHLLDAISPDNPCGMDLSADPRRFELDNIARGKPARSEGDKEIPAEEPNWVRVRELAETLLKTSKDLRVLMHLTRALVKTDGYSGLAAAVALLRGYVVDHWESVFPLLDPEDKNDPTERLNILAELNDSEKLVQFVRVAPLVSSRELGVFSLRDYEIASGKQAVPAGTSAPKTSTIDSCFRAAEIDTLKVTIAAIESCLDALSAIVKALPEKLLPKEQPDAASPENTQAAIADAPAAPDLLSLVQNLRSAHKLVDAGIKQRLGGNTEPLLEQGTETVNSPNISSGSGTIRNRDDCIKALDLVADYFRKNERSSPLPLLLERAKRLVTKDFLEIMQDLAPDGVSQASKVLGTDPKKT